MIRLATTRKRLSAIFLVVFFALSILIPQVQQANALSGSDFQSGRIIDDAVFFNKDAMNAQQVQEFLNAKVPVCDRNHQATFTKNGVYHQPPYTCLKEYNENPTTRENNIGRFNADGSPYQVPGGKSAAQIIVEAGLLYGINPQVLIVMLQKETGLVTDTWAATWQYDRAMGYACPDTAACNTSYYGFYNQVTSAARQLRRYTTNPDGYNFKAGVTRNVLFNPNTSCGSSPVYLENAGTAALYNYTPYQPNPEALATMNDTTPGGTVACGAYGNRNFFWFFNKWFGSTKFIALKGCDQATNTTIACVWSLWNVVTEEQVLSTSYDETNHLIRNGGYAFLGVNFLANVSIAPQPGNIPIYLLTKSNGATFLTASLAERDMLVATKGYAGRGIGFYADPSLSNSGYPVYRLYSPSKDKYVWVGDVFQRNTLVNSGYVDQGIPFTSISSVKQEAAALPGKMLVYRFYIPQTYAHLWTVNIDERDTMIKAGYTYEGVGWQSSSKNSDQPIYRLYAPSLRQHLYTLDENERNVLSGSGNWLDEGIALYVSKTPNSNPVYRLYSPKLHVHHLTSDGYERSVLLSSGNWQDEGIAWYQP